MGRSWQYIAGFATAVCLICSVIVSGSAVALKEQQEANKVLDRQKKVLNVAGLLAEDAQVSADEVTALFKKHVKARIVDMKTNTFDEKTDAATYEEKKLLGSEKTATKMEKKPAGVQWVPNKALMYEIMIGKGVEMVVLPIRGKGLWGEMKGYLALSANTETVRGITYYQHVETPGLGGEVDNPKWKAQWPGKSAFDDKGEPAIKVVKGKGSGPYQIDGLSGATITSRSVGSMVRFWLGDKAFGPFLENYRKGKVKS